MAGSCRTVNVNPSAGINGRLCPARLWWFCSICPVQKETVNHSFMYLAIVVRLVIWVTYLGYGIIYSPFFRLVFDCINIVTGDNTIFLPVTVVAVH